MKSSLRLLGLLGVMGFGVFSHAMMEGEGQGTSFLSVEEVERGLDEQIARLEREVGEPHLSQKEISDLYEQIEYLISKKDGLYLEKEISKLIKRVEDAELGSVVLDMNREDVVIHQCKQDTSVLPSSSRLTTLRLTIEPEKEDYVFTWLIKEYYKFLELVSMGGYNSACCMLSERHKRVVIDYLNALADKSSEWKANGFNHNSGSLAEKSADAPGSVHEEYETRVLESDSSSFASAVSVSQITKAVESAKNLDQIIDESLKVWVMVHDLYSGDGNVEHLVGTIKQSVSKFVPAKQHYLNTKMSLFLNGKYSNVLGGPIVLEPQKILMRIDAAIDLEGNIYLLQ